MQAMQAPPLSAGALSVMQNLAAQQYMTADQQQQQQQQQQHSGLHLPPQPQLGQAGLLQGSASLAPGQIQQPAGLPQQCMGTHLPSQPPGLVGAGTAGVPFLGQQMQRTAVPSHAYQVPPQAMQQQVPSALQQLQQHPHLPLGQPLSTQQHPAVYHDLSQPYAYGHHALPDMTSHPVAGTTAEDGSKMGTSLTQRPPHLHAELPRTPSPGEQKLSQPHQVTGAQQHHPLPPQQQMLGGYLAQQLGGQSYGVQPQPQPQSQPQQQLVNAPPVNAQSLQAQDSTATHALMAGLGFQQSVPVGVVSADSAGQSSKPPIAPQVRQVMAMDIRPRAGSEPKIMHQHPKREDSPSKMTRPEQAPVGPQRSHTTVDPHVKRTQSLKERTFSLSGVTQEGPVVSTQGTPQPSPKPQRRQTVDGAISGSGMQQAVQQFQVNQAVVPATTVVQQQQPPVTCQVPAAAMVPGQQQQQVLQPVTNANSAAAQGPVDPANVAAAAGAAPNVIQQQQQSISTTSQSAVTAAASGSAQPPQ